MIIDYTSYNIVPLPGFYLPALVRRHFLHRPLHVRLRLLHGDGCHHQHYHSPPLLYHHHYKPHHHPLYTGWRSLVHFDRNWSWIPLGFGLYVFATGSFLLDLSHILFCLVMSSLLSLHGTPSINFSTGCLDLAHLDSSPTRHLLALVGVNITTSRTEHF